MAAMTKRVNINASVAIRNITPPIYGVCKNVIMSTGDILKCLCKRAIVDEILPDGSTVRLNMRNYYTDNGAGLDASVIDAVKEEFVGQSAAQDEEPAAAVVVNTDQTNVSGVVNETEDEDNAASVREDNSNDITVDESTATEETSADTDGQIEEDVEETTASSDDVADEDPAISLTEEVSSDDNIEADKSEEMVDEADSATEIETVKEEKSETVEKKPTAKSTSSTKKKSSNSSSKKKTTSNK